MPRKQPAQRPLCPQLLEHSFIVTEAPGVDLRKWLAARGGLVTWVDGLQVFLTADPKEGGGIKSSQQLGVSGFPPCYPLSSALKKFQPIFQRK